MKIHIDDEVRVVGASSQWRGLRGTVVEIVERKVSNSDDKVQECAVTLGDQRRWFMSDHLLKVVPQKFHRFLRSEIIDRWPVNPELLWSLDGSRNQLIDLLCDNLDFSGYRAETEVDEFLAAFEQKIHRATEAPTPGQYFKAARPAA